MKKLIKDWEFNIIGIDNFNKPGKLKSYYDFIRENHTKIAGDICEVGVFKGFSLLATAMLLKELNSKKIVWGFDSFEGFPNYNENDKLDNFKILHNKGIITDEHFLDFKLNVKHKNFLSSENINVSNISLIYFCFC